jgi:hypothetical protein
MEYRPRQSKEGAMHEEVQGMLTLLLAVVCGVAFLCYAESCSTRRGYEKARFLMECYEKHNTNWCREQTP